MLLFLGQGLVGKQNYGLCHRTLKSDMLYVDPKLSNR